MEKLKLKALQIGAKQILTRTQMKSIAGGSGCNPTQCLGVNNGSGPPGGNGYCGWWDVHTCACIVQGFPMTSGTCSGQ